MGNETFTTMLGGTIDRLDSITTSNGADQIRVIDYKTGSRRHKPLADVDAIFAQESLKDHSDYYLQAFLYSHIVRNKSNNVAVAPALLFIQHAGTDDYNPILKFGNEYINDVATADGDQFVRLLVQKIDEIFNSSLTFVPTDDTDRCHTCPYASLCGL
jgi:CRISPR/Cas system-associated exonuclease Cas4 (RecB family)